MHKKVGLFSFFAGAGFLDLGFEKTKKYDILFVNEFHRAFMEIYQSTRSNLKIHEPVYGHQGSDIAINLNQKENKCLKNHLKEAKKEYEWIGFIGGPPCPDFSIGGKNRGHQSENGKLSGTYIELIKNSKPDFFLFENVKGLYRTQKHREFFDNLKRGLIKAEYIITEKLINAIEYGVPQDRERIILIGFHRNMLDDLGYKTNGYPILKNFNWKKYTIFDTENVFKLNWPVSDKFEIDSIKKQPPNLPVNLTVEHWFKKNFVNNHPNAINFFRPKNGLKKFLTIEEGDDSKKSFKRLHRWRYSPTAAYGNNEVHLHPYKARRLSAAETLAVQSLPKDFVIPSHITLTNMFKAIGNGVPYLAARGLANSIYDFLYNDSKND